MTEPASINPNNISSNRTAARHAPEQADYSRQTADGRESITYTVKKGDTLGQIRQGAAVFAKSDGVELGADQTVANIAHQSAVSDPNNPNKLSIGDKIVIYVKSRSMKPDNVHVAAARSTAGRHDVATISAQAASAGRGDLKDFLASLKTNYEGKLKGNPELQAKFLAEVGNYVNEHFMAGYEGGKQIDIDDNFVLTADNASQLSVGIDPKDGHAKIKADCGLFAQAYELCFKSAGLQTSYTGSFINLGSVRGGHVQVAGYLPGDNFLIMNNNARSERFGLSYSKEASQTAARQMLKQDFGSRVSIYGTISGVRKQSEVAGHLGRQALRHETMANIENGIQTLMKYSGGLRMIKNAGSKDEFMAKVSAYKAKTGDTLRSLGFTLEEQTKGVLASYQDIAEKMDGLLADVKELRAKLDPKKDFPMTLKVGQDEIVFKSLKELDTFINQKSIDIATYNQDIAHSLLLFT